MSEDRVTFRRQISDGNYGSEMIEVVLSVLEGMDSAEELEMARTLVQEELLRSPSLVVRRTMERELNPTPAVDSAGHPPNIEEVPF